MTVTMKTKTPYRDATRRLVLGVRWWRYRAVRAVSDRVARWVTREGSNLLVVHRRCGDLNEASQATDDVKHLFYGVLVGLAFVAMFWLLAAL